MQSLGAHLKFGRSPLIFSDAIIHCSSPQNNHLWTMPKKKHHHLKTKITEAFIHVLNHKTMANFEKITKKNPNFESNKRKCSTTRAQVSLLPSNVAVKTTESCCCIRKHNKMRFEIFVSRHYPSVCNSQLNTSWAISSVQSKLHTTAIQVSSKITLSQWRKFKCKAVILLYEQ